MTIRFTLIARQDGLPLVATMESQNDEESIAAHKKLAKTLCRLVSSTSGSYSSSSMPPKASVTAGDLTFHYMVDTGIIYLAICERQYPRLLAFSFLSEVCRGFIDEVNSTSTSGFAGLSSLVRPYAFIRFEPFIQSARKRYQNTRQLRPQEDLVELSSRIQSIPVQRAEDVFGPEYSRSSAAPSSGFPTIASLTKTANSITSALQDSTSGTNPAARSSVVIQVLYYLAVAVALLDFLYLIGWWYFRTKSADVTVDPLKFWFVLLLGALSPFVVLQAHMMKSQGTTPKRLGDLATVHAIVTTVFLIYVLLVVGVGPLEDGKLDASGAAVASHVSPTPAIVSPAVASPDVPPGVVLAPVVVPPAGPLPALGNDTAANATNPEGPPALGAAGAGEKGDGKAAVADAPASPSPVSPSPATPFPAVVDPAKPHGVKGGVHPDKAAPKTSVKRLLPLWVIALKTLYVIPMWVVVGAGSVQRWMGVRVRKGRSD